MNLPTPFAELRQTLYMRVHRDLDDSADLVFTVVARMVLRLGHIDLVDRKQVGCARPAASGTASLDHGASGC